MKSPQGRLPQPLKSKQARPTLSGRQLRKSVPSKQEEPLPCIQSKTYSISFCLQKVTSKGTHNVYTQNLCAVRLEGSSMSGLYTNRGGRMSMKANCYRIPSCGYWRISQVCGRTIALLSSVESAGLIWLGTLISQTFQYKNSSTVVRVGQRRDNRDGMEIVLIIRLYIIGMNVNSGGEIIFTHTINSLPTLEMPSVVAALPLEHTMPTAKNVAFAITKLISMQRPKSIEEMMEKVALIAPQDSFFTKIAIFYAVGLVFLALRGVQRPRITLLQKQVCTVSMSLVQRQEQCSSFLFQFTSKTVLSKQQCLDSLWNTIECVMKLYGVIFEQINKNTVEIRYINPIFQGGLELPSLLRIKNEREMVLAYPSPCKEGIPLHTYLQLIRRVGSRCDERYDFWRIIVLLAYALQSCITKLHKQDCLYGEISFRDVYVIDKEEFTVEIGLSSCRTTEWKEREWSQLSRKIIFNKSPNPVRQDLFDADRCAIATVIIEAIAIKHQIISFSRKLREAAISNRLTSFLQDFLQYLQTERCIMDSPLLKKLKIWLNMYNQSENKEQSDEMNNYSFILLSEAVQRNSLQKKSIQQHRLLPQQRQLQLRQYAQIQKGTIKEEELISQVDEIVLQQMQALKFNEQFSNYTAKRLEDSQIDQFCASIIKNDVFFQCLKFNLKSFTTRKAKCLQCLQNKTIYINTCNHDHSQSQQNKNCCNHGKCLQCFLPLIEIAVSEHHGQQPYKIKCDNEKCQEELCFPLIRKIIQNNGTAVRRYCQLLFKKYASKHPDSYSYCQQQSCTAFNTIYINKNSRILICENCKRAACVECHRTPHKPLFCKQVQKMEEDINKQVNFKMKEMEWPFDQKTQKQQYSKLIESSLGMKNFGDCEVILKEWLFLLICHKRHTKGKPTPQSDFLQSISKKLTSIIKEIYFYLESQTQGALQCVNLCILLQQILSQRENIVAFYYNH